MYRKEPQSYAWKHYDFIILDVLVMQVSYILAFWMRFGLVNPYAEGKYVILAMVMGLIDFATILFAGTFRSVLRRGYLIEFEKTFQQLGIFIVVETAFLYFTKTGNEYSRILVVTTAILAFILNYVSRVIYKRILNRSRKKTLRQCLILTNEAEANDFISLIKENVTDATIGGIVLLDKDLTGATIEGIEVVASRGSAASFICQNWVDEVFVRYPLGEDYPYDVLNNLIIMGITIHQDIQRSSMLEGQVKIWEKVGNYQMLTTAMGTMSFREAFLKRSMDIAGGLVGCFITGILWLILAPQIKRESPGPVFFAQVRIGKNGKKFKMYKFRSMYMDAEERKKELMEQNRVKGGMMFKVEYDPRIIGCKLLPDGTIQKGIGNKIRDWSIDEFPQFWNVLKGEMSLVGTRPPTLDEWEKYEYHHRARMATRPGITGMWQVSGRSEITDFEEVVRLDTEYINNWSLNMDIKIILKTIKVALKREGAM